MKRRKNFQREKLNHDPLAISNIRDITVFGFVSILPTCFKKRLRIICAELKYKRTII